MPSGYSIWPGDKFRESLPGKSALVMLLKQGLAIRLVRFHSRGKIMKNILSTGLRIAGKTLQRGAVSATMLLALGLGSANAGDLTILHINDHHSHLKP
ncbi:MAG: hypothetical protein VW870_13060, partial [Rhodobiaceae bacterium]